MLDVLDPIHFLQLRVLQEESGHEPFVKQYIYIFVDSGGDQEPAMVLVVRWQVGSSATE